MTYELNEITVEITEIYSRAFMEKIRKIIKATIVLWKTRNSQTSFKYS